jgi:trans-2,3-dihydro-3-hydroxyanthranilate isomerase
VGPIQVEIFARQGMVQHIVMSQKKPEFMAIYNPADVMPLFGLTVEDVLPKVPIQTVSTGTPQLMIPVHNLDILQKIQFDAVTYAQFRANADFFSTHLFCLQGLTEAGDTFARHFVEPPDLIEDPFTGSATGGMGAYLWHYGLIDQPTFKAEQGHWMHRPGLGIVEVVGSRDDIETVKVVGSAVAIVRGELVL